MRLQQFGTIPDNCRQLPRLITQHPINAHTSLTLHRVSNICQALLLVLLLLYRYKLNIWDVGGQKTLRPYWRNYYEKTDGLIWVIDSADLARLEDCKKELHGLLQEERLFGATLLILANKQDIPAALSLQEIEQVGDGLQKLVITSNKVGVCFGITATYSSSSNSSMSNAQQQSMTLAPPCPDLLAITARQQSCCPALLLSGGDKHM